MLRALFTNLRRTLAGLDRAERVILFGALLLHGAAIAWGLPSSDAWDNDGVAPRDVFPGLVETFTPGSHYTYPPLQLLLIALVTLPASLYALARAPSLSQADLVHAFLDPRVMTVITVGARLLSCLFSLGIVLALGELAALIAGPRFKRARAFGMALGTVEVALTYYAQTSNLDVPYLFWASLALLSVAQSVAEDRPRGLRRSALFAAFAIATKDQAYALFLLSLPLIVMLWAAASGRDGSENSPPPKSASPRALLKEAALAAVIGIGTVLLIDGAVYNPTGFAARVRFLLGPASQDFAQYSKDFQGRLDAFADSWLPFDQHYPIAFAPLFVAGFVASFFVGKRTRESGAASERRRRWIIAILPALSALSFTLTFNCAARRVEERFVMPQMLLVSVYGAVALAKANSALRGRVAKALFGLVVAAGFAWAIRMSASVDAVMLRDPRYTAEAWLKAHAAPEDPIEVYGMNVYLPRFAPWMHVTRIETAPVNKRGPMPGIVEVQDRYGAIAARNPRFVVVGEGYAWRYLIGEWGGSEGRVQPLIHRENLTDHDARDHFHRLFDGTGGYHTALRASYDGKLFPVVRMHGSLGAEVWIFERNAP